MKKVLIISGGTMVHVAPHFSLCAPAYGKVGEDFAEVCRDKTINHELVKTKMAGGYSIETNEDLENFITSVLLKEEDIGAVVFAAAVCDWKPETLFTQNGQDGEFTEEFGKDQPRLSSKYDCTLDLIPTSKIIHHVKNIRPDVFLVTFKTTSNDEEALFQKARKNQLDSGADLVFANDIATHKNMVVGKHTIFSSSREACVKYVCEKIKDAL